MKIEEAFSIRIKYLLKEKGMTAEELSKKSDVSHNYINKLITGTAKNLHIQEMGQISIAFEMPLHEFLDDEVFHHLETKYTKK